VKIDFLKEIKSLFLFSLAALTEEQTDPKKATKSTSTRLILHRFGLHYLYKQTHTPFSNQFVIEIDRK